MSEILLPLNNKADRWDIWRSVHTSTHTLQDWIYTLGFTTGKLYTLNFTTVSNDWLYNYILRFTTGRKDWLIPMLMEVIHYTSTLTALVDSSLILDQLLCVV